MILRVAEEEALREEPPASCLPHANNFPGQSAAMEPLRVARKLRRFQRSTCFIFFPPDQPLRTLLWLVCIGAQRSSLYIESLFKCKMNVNNPKKALTSKQKSNIAFTSGYNDLARTRLTGLQQAPWRLVTGYTLDRCAFSDRSEPQTQTAKVTVCATAEERMSQMSHLSPCALPPLLGWIRHGAGENEPTMCCKHRELER